MAKRKGKRHLPAGVSDHLLDPAYLERCPNMRAVAEAHGVTPPKRHPKRAKKSAASDAG